MITHCNPMPKTRKRFFYEVQVWRNGNPNMLEAHIIPPHGIHRMNLKPMALTTALDMMDRLNAHLRTVYAS